MFTKAVFALLVFVSSAVHAKTCHLIHANEELLSSLTKLIRQATRLNPDLFHREIPKDVASLYLALKVEEWKYGSIPLREVPKLLPLPASLVEHLKVEFQKSHDLEAANNEALTRFYINALRGLYSRAAEEVKTSIVRKYTTEEFSDIEHFALGVIESYWAPKDLKNRELSPEMAAELLRVEIQFPWEKAFALVRAWEKEKAASRFFSRRDFHQWIETRKELEVSVHDLDRIIRALEIVDVNRIPICCASNPGCAACPQNRRSLRR